MKVRYLPLVLVAGLLLAFGAIAACGDDGDNGNGEELTIEQYFQRLETLGQDYDDEGNALDEQAGEDFDATESDEEATDVFVTFVEDTASLTEDFVGDIDNLNPPAEVADVHSEAVTSGQELGDMYDNALTVLDTAETFEDATLVLEGPGFVDAMDRFGAACVALQGIADSNDIDVDLRCPS